MDEKFRVVLLGLEKSPEHFEREMTRLGVPASAVRRIVTMAPVVIKKGLAEPEARRFAAVVRSAGGRVTVQAWQDGRGAGAKGLPPMGPPLSAFTLCPQCGLKQRAGVACERCGNPLTGS